MSSPGESQLPRDPLNGIERSIEQLTEIVGRYDLGANGDLRPSLESLRKRTAGHRLTLAVFSDSRQSKSNLIHALLNTTLDEALIPPSTSACTYLAYGLRAECAVTLANSMTAWLPLEQLAAFVSERVPASDLKKVLVRFPNTALESGLRVIDTPELAGEPAALLPSVAEAIAEADACVFVVQAGEELKENAIASLAGMKGKLKKFFFVVDGSASQEQEGSLEPVRRSLEERCGLSNPPIALLASASPEACREELLGFARLSWQNSISSEVARVAGETLAEAGALNLRKTAPLERARLRRVVKALDDISRESAGLALKSDEAMHSLRTPVVELPNNPMMGASRIRGDERAPAAESAVPLAPIPASVSLDTQQLHQQRSWEPASTITTIGIMGTTGTTRAMPSFTRESVAVSLATPLVPEPAERIARRADPRAVATPAVSRESRPESVAARSLPADPVPRSFEWCANRIPLTDDADYEDDEEEPTHGKTLWRVAGFVALLAALLVIAWAAIIVERPDMARQITSRLDTARLTAMSAVHRERAAFLQKISPQPAAPQAAALQPVSPQPATPQAASPQPAAPQAAVPQPVSPQPVSPQPATPPAVANGAQMPLQGIANEPAKPVSRSAGAKAVASVERTPGAMHGGPALGTVLDRWIAATRSGNIQAQLACYAPVVDDYFNSRNLTRREVQNEKEREMEATAGVQNYHITTIGISPEGNGQRAVLVEKNWDTPTGRGPGFAGTEIERLVFAQVDGQWKIVGEQEVKLPKVHHAHR